MIQGVVIPAAGLGTRFLPYTKSIAKEMLPIINKPAIEYIVKEAILSDINNIFLITNKAKQSIANYFKPISPKIIKALNPDSRSLLLDLENIIKKASFCYIDQEKQLGLGHAVLMAKEKFINNSYFAVMLPDDIIISEIPALLQLIKIHKENKCSVIAVQEVPRESVSSYGVIKIKEQINDKLFKIADLIEKPKIENSPSNLGIIGRYILSSKIFDSIEKIGFGSKNEIQLTDAITNMLENGETVFAYKIDGNRFDIGTPEGWLKANFELYKK